MDGTLDKLPLSRAERHPEKAHRPDNPIPRKPDWIRVRAPNTRGYADTRNIVRANGQRGERSEAGDECGEKEFHRAPSPTRA